MVVDGSFLIPDSKNTIKPHRLVSTSYNQCITQNPGVKGSFIRLLKATQVEGDTQQQCQEN